MAKALPSAQDLGVASAQPTLGVASYKGATGMEDDAARATMYAGQQFAQVAQRMEQEQEKLDNLRAEDRINQYQEELNKLALDPEAGWANAKGEKAIGGDFVKTHADKFEEARNKLLDSLDTPGAKRRFAQLSAGVTMRHRSKLYEHSAKERIAYDGKVANDTVTGILQESWRSYGDDGLFAANMARAVAVTEEFARSQGLNEQGIKNATRELQSRMWKQRIGAAVAAGDTMLAREYMGKATGTLTSADKAEIDAKIRPQMQAAEVQTTVSGLLDNMMSKDPNDPFPANAIDEALRKKYGNNPEALRLARAEVAHRRGQNEIQQRENNANNIGAVMSGLFEKNQSLAQVMRMPEFQNLSGDVRAKVIQQYETLTATRAARASAAANRDLANLQRQQTALELAGAETYARLTGNPEALKQMPVNSIIEMAPNIGWRHTQNLINAKNQLEKPGSLHIAKLNTAAFRGIINDYLTEEQRNLLASTPKNEAQRTQKRDLLQRINTAQMQVGSVLEQRKITTLEQAEVVARDALEKTVTFRDTALFGSNETTTPALLVPRNLPPAEVARLKVPMAEIPAIDRLKVIAEIKGIRTELAKDKGLTDARLMTELQKDIEAVVGMQRAGIPADRIREYIKNGW